MAQLFDPDEFWEFSGQLYERAGVKECCLTLQNRHGIDINLLLLCCWIDRQQLVIAQASLEGLIKLSDKWQTEQLSPLRAARAELDRGSELYQSALRRELDTEKTEQRAMIDLLNRPRALDYGQAFYSEANCIAYAAKKPFPLDNFSALVNQHR